MIDRGKQNLPAFNIDGLDYERAFAKITGSAHRQQRCWATALAAHGLVTGASDTTHRFRLNHFDLVVPDGQPVRWALNLLYGPKLPDRGYGPKLTLLLCRAAAKEGLPIFFYGSTQTVITKLCERMKELCPGLQIAGAKASEYRSLTTHERASVVERIAGSGARLLFAGLGCPRQEVFAYEMSQQLSMPIIAVGAAFDYYAGLLSEPPEFIQRAGLQWLYRIAQEPGRLWRRYLTTNSQFVALFLMQVFRLWRPDPNRSEEPLSEFRYG